MGDNKVLRMRYKASQHLDILVDDPDESSMLDVFIGLLEGASKQNFCIPENPSLWYVHGSKSHKLEKDSQLLEMLTLFHDKKVINIAIGSMESPCDILQLARGLIESKIPSSDTSRPSSNHTIPSTGYMDETRPVPTSEPVECEPSQPPQPIHSSESEKRVVSFDIPLYDLPNHVTAPQYHDVTSLRVQQRKIPATTARRKGILLPSKKSTSSGNEMTSGCLSRTRERQCSNENMREKTHAPEIIVNLDDEDEPKSPEKQDSLGQDEFVDEGNTWPVDVDDGYDPERSNEWKFDKKSYFDRLYENGEFYADNQFGNILLRKWMIFFNKSHLTNVLRDYYIQEGFSITTLKSDLKRLTAICSATDCEWRIHASKLPDGYTWAIKDLLGSHTCTRLGLQNPMATVSWAAEKLLEDIRSCRDITGKEINDKLRERFGITLKKTSTYDTKKLALKNIDGDHDTSFAKLPGYCEVLKSTNPGCKAHCSWKVAEDVLEKPIQFKSIFISFKPMIEGFRGCRALIGVDGAHLKGNHSGVLLSAVAVDGNTEIFPLAYGIYENESKATWSSFLFHLKDALKDDDRANLTIISDRQKGIEPALDDIWPTIKRRYCCRHLCANFKKTYPGKLMHQLFWGVCDTFSEFTYKNAVKRLEDTTGWGAVKWLHETGEKERWTRHKFDPTLCSAENTSNFAEAFNSTISIDRSSPVLSLLEGIRRTHMVRYAGRQANAEAMSDQGVTTKIAQKLNQVIQDSRAVQVYKASNNECEVKDGRSFLAVNIPNRTCACGVWQISGIPCKHAVWSILHLRAGIPLENYVSAWFSKQAYKVAYSVNFHPVPDESQWPEFDFPNLVPPTMKRGVGRPSRNRRREEGEQRKGKRSGTVRCGKCKAFGHNMKTCKGGLTAREHREQGVVVEQRPRQKRKRNVGTSASQSEDRTTSHAPDLVDVMGSAPS